MSINFGANYISRNTRTPQVLAGSLKFWSSILQNMRERPNSVLELGANIGNNLHALRLLLPDAQLVAVEINPTTAEHFRQWGQVEVFETSLLNFTSERQWDLVVTCGALIHINPTNLLSAYEVLQKYSTKDVCLAEYYNPEPEEIVYRNHSEKMFRRDFAGEFLEAYPNMSLRSYGFTYRRDPVFLMDDMNWFLMEK